MERADSGRRAFLCFFVVACCARMRAASGVAPLQTTGDTRNCSRFSRGCAVAVDGEIASTAIRLPSEQVDSNSKLQPFENLAEAETSRDFCRGTILGCCQELAIAGADCVGYRLADSACR